MRLTGHRFAAPALVAALLAGCISLDLGAKAGRRDLAYFDLAGGMADSATGNPSNNPSGGPSSRSSGNRSAIPAAPSIGLRSIDVVAPTWLDAPAMQYRLAYVDPARRASFAESRWVAPPPELLEQALRKSMISTELRGAPGLCRLQIDVDEFVQVFDTPQSSYAVIELRASLLASRSDVLVARKTFRASRPAQTADARGGVGALAGATDDVSGAIRDWIENLSTDSAGGVAVAPRCRAN